MPYPLIETRVAGIPCQMHVLSHYYEAPSADCPGDFDFEWELYDRKGYRAKWLEKRFLAQSQAAQDRDVEQMEEDLRNYYED